MGDGVPPTGPSWLDVGLQDTHSVAVQLRESCSLLRYQEAAGHPLRFLLLIACRRTKPVSRGFICSRGAAVDNLLLLRKLFEVRPHQLLLGPPHNVGSQCTRGFCTHSRTRAAGTTPRRRGLGCVQFGHRFRPFQPPGRELPWAILSPCSPHAIIFQHPALGLRRSDECKHVLVAARCTTLITWSNGGSTLSATA